MKCTHQSAAFTCYAAISLIIQTSLLKIGVLSPNEKFTVKKKKVFELILDKFYITKQA